MQVLKVLSEPSKTRRAIVYEFSGSLGWIGSYLEKPTKNTLLIVVSMEKNPKFPKHHNSLIVECCDGSNVSQLKTIAKLHGMDDDTALFLLNRVNKDADRLLQALRIISLFPLPHDRELIESVVPEQSDILSFDVFHVIETVSDVSLCEQLKRRFKQLSLFTMYQSQKLNVVDLVHHTGLEAFLLVEFRSIVRYTTSPDWLRKVAIVEIAEEAARNQMPLVREFIFSSLKGK
jgi:hypothetical protein